MTEDVRFDVILYHLSQNHISKTNLATLREVVSRAFPESSPIRQSVEDLASRFSDQPAEGAAAALDADFLAITDAAKSFVTHSSATDGAKKQQTLDEVNRAFYDSALFQVAKWVLAVSLGLIGVGSLGYAGINFYVADRIQSAQQRVTDSTAKFNEFAKSIDYQRTELNKKQNSALKDVQDTIEQNAAAINAKFQEESKLLMANWKKAIKTQTNDFKNTTIAEARAEIKKATQTHISEIQKAAKESMDKLSTAAGQGSAAIAQQAGAKVTDLKTLGDLKQRDIESAAGDVANTLKKALKARGQQIELGLVEKEGEIQKTLDQKVTDAKQAIDAKVTDINAKSADAAGKIATVTSEMAAAESRFTSGMKERLAFWDQSVQTALHRLDELAKKDAALSVNQENLSRRIGALSKSSAAALNVAAKLSAGTSTQRLDLIGAVLEDASFIVIGFSAGALISLGLSLYTLIAWRRRTRAEQAKG